MERCDPWGPWAERADRFCCFPPKRRGILLVERSFAFPVGPWTEKGETPVRQKGGWGARKPGFCGVQFPEHSKGPKKRGVVRGGNRELRSHDFGAAPASDRAFNGTPFRVRNQDHTLGQSISQNSLQWGKQKGVVCRMPGVSMTFQNGAMTPVLWARTYFFERHGDSRCLFQLVRNLFKQRAGPTLIESVRF